MGHILSEALAALPWYFTGGWRVIVKIPALLLLLAITGYSAVLASDTMSVVLGAAGAAFGVVGIGVVAAYPAVLAAYVLAAVTPVLAWLVFIASARRIATASGRAPLAMAARFGGWLAVLGLFTYLAYQAQMLLANLLLWLGR